MVGLGESLAKGKEALDLGVSVWEENGSPPRCRISIVIKSVGKELKYRTEYHQRKSRKHNVCPFR